MPEIGARDRVPCPVRFLGIAKNDAGIRIALIIVGPYVKVTSRRPRLGMAGALKPGVLVRGVIYNELGDDPQAPLVGCLDEPAHIGQRTIVFMHAAVLRNVVTVVQTRRWVKRQQPDSIDTEAGDVIELGDQPGKIALSIIVGVEEGLHMQLIDDSVLVPELVVDQFGPFFVGLGHESSYLICGCATGGWILRRATIHSIREMAGPAPALRTAGLRAAQKYRRRTGCAGAWTDPAPHPIDQPESPGCPPVVRTGPG